VKLLLRSGADPDALNYDRKTPLQVASNPDNPCTNPGLERVVLLLSGDQQSDHDIDNDTVDVVDRDPLPAVEGRRRVSDGRKLGDRPRARGKLFAGSIGDRGSMSTSEEVSSSTQPPQQQREDDVYEFKTSSKEATPTSSRGSASPSSASVTTDTTNEGKRQNEDEEDTGGAKKRKKDDVAAAGIAGSGSGVNSTGGSSGGSTSGPTSGASNNSAASNTSGSGGGRGRGMRGTSSEKSIGKQGGRGRGGAGIDRRSPPANIRGDNSPAPSPGKSKQTKSEGCVISGGNAISSSGSNNSTGGVGAPGGANSGGTGISGSNSGGNSNANSVTGAGGESDEDSGDKNKEGGSLKVPPLKIVLNGGGNNSNGRDEDKKKTSYIVNTNSEDGEPSESSSGGNGGGSAGTASIANGNNSGPSLTTNNTGNVGGSLNVGVNSGNKAIDAESAATDEKTGSRVTRSRGGGNTDEEGPSEPAAEEERKQTNEYVLKKRKMRNQQEEASLAGNGLTNRPSGEPLTDIEKHLNIRKQIEQRRKNLFPVQPKPPHGFRDYLMNKKTYHLQGNTGKDSRIQPIPKIAPPPSLDDPLKDLFLGQENERYKLRMKHLVEKEKLVLAVEQEILRVHGRAARALANQSLPYSVCTILRDKEIYTPIDPNQEEKNRDIRSRYNGRLFISWLQDVDDKWEKIKEQMVLRHHNEAESLNAVQRMDWEWKLGEIPGAKNRPCPDDLHVPMVQVSDDFDQLLS